jgi:peptide/nickel transport system substrate-binding protein
MGSEPSSLYLYSTSSPEADAIMQSIYDGPVDLRGYKYQPVILSKLPTFSDGDARIESVAVSAGEIYLNPETQQPDILSPGKPFIPAGCTNSDCQSEYDQGEVAINRLVVDFELLPGVEWSDGEPLTVNDSVFSFKIDADDDTPTTKYLIHRTSIYEALDDLHARWIGIPGFIDADFQANFWSPLPEHILKDMTALELLSNELSTSSPIGWGPYIIDNWDRGEEIILRRSENYYRSSEGLPKFELLRLRFLGSDFVSAMEQVLTGECDVLDESVVSNTLLNEAIGFAEDGRLKFNSTQGATMQRMDFNLGSEGTTTIFGDIRMRRAFAGCLDREELVAEALLGLSVVPETYLPPEHPFHTPDPDYELPTLDQAMDMLTAVGWLDDDGEPGTPRISAGVSGVVNGTPLEVIYYSPRDYFSEIITPKMVENVARCGIQIVAELGEPSELFEPWPNGPIFGRRFDIVGWAWPTFTSPPCEMFAGFEIPSVDNIFGVNATGFHDPDYDRACKEILTGGSSNETFAEAVNSTERIFRDQMPSIPLYLHPRSIVFGSDVCGPQQDPTTFSALWNLEEYGVGEPCN